MIGRLLDIFEGPEAMAPWSPPPCPEPLHELLPWRAWDEGTELYVNAASHGFVLELPPFAGIDAETLGALAGVLADAAPERCTIQFIHWASPRFGAPLEAWAAARRQPAARREPAARRKPAARCDPAARERTGGLLSVMADRREALFGHAGWRPLHPGGPPFTCADYRVFIAACRAGLPGPASETALGAFRRALEGTLASAGAHARRLSPDELLSLAGEFIAPEVGQEEVSAGRAPSEPHGAAALLRPARRWSPRDPLHVQCASPGRAMTVTPEGLLFHHPDNTDVAVRVLSALSFPEVWPGWRGNALIGDFHRDFLQPGCPVLTCLTVMSGDAADGEKAFLKSARATQQAGTGISRYLPGLPEKARDWRFVTERLKDGERLVRASYQVAVYARSENIDEAEQAVRAIYHGQGWRVSAERYVQLPSWLACLPMLPAGGLDADLGRMGRMKTLLSAAAVNLAPLHGEWRGQPLDPENPPVLLLIGRRGQPAGWSPFANDAGNYNVAVTGKSGSGKSVLMQELVAGLVAAGGEAVVIDDGRSFQHTAEALDGEFIQFGRDSACLNPFAMIDAAAAEADDDYREECFSMLGGVVRRMCRRQGTMDDIEAALIDGAIADAWEEAGNNADLGHVQRRLQDHGDSRALDMSLSLGPWCPGGASGRLFAGNDVPALDAAFTVFELAELKGRKDVQAVVLMLVVFLATQRMYHGDRTVPKAIVVDEAWDLLSGDDSRGFIEGAARRARKYRGALVTGTQSVNDYYANPAARAAWDNADWVIFLSQKDESVELLKTEKRIHCDPGMERALKSLRTAAGRYAELVLHGPDGWRVGRLVLDAWSVALFSSRGPAFAAVETLKEQGLSTAEAIARVVGERVDGSSRTAESSRTPKSSRTAETSRIAKRSPAAESAESESTDTGATGRQDAAA